MTTRTTTTTSRTTSRATARNKGRDEVAHLYPGIDARVAREMGVDLVRMLCGRWGPLKLTPLPGGQRRRVCRQCLAASENPRRWV